MPVTPPTSAVLRPAGCFVSLHRRQGHALRGCIGRIDCASPLLEAMLNVAWGAAQDPRFASQPITLTELPELTIELSILGPLQPTADPLAFNPQADGIYLAMAGKAGVFLPQVARDTGWSREQLLDRLTQEKLGLPPASWRQPNARVFTFATDILGPVDFAVDANFSPHTPPPKNAVTVR